MSDLPTDLQTLRERIAALPEKLRVEGDDDNGTDVSKTDGPLHVIARQGRLILRLTAAVEATETRLKTQEEMGASLATAQTAAAQAEEETRRVLRETALPLMDALDFAATAASTSGDAALANAIAGARRDGLRRLAGVGISEIPATSGTLFDGRLHEAVESRPAPPGSSIAQYAILAVVRPGYQRGTDILRRATVITAG
ncbi:MAG: nucleotide exchange factor GrpE [Fibrella sp.]|nr:nucleotide exchange factor GrpE [Armatimonadota bacterium]